MRKTYPRNRRVALPLTGVPGERMHFSLIFTTRETAVRTLFTMGLPNNDGSNYDSVTLPEITINHPEPGIFMRCIGFFLPCSKIEISNNGYDLLLEFQGAPTNEPAQINVPENHPDLISNERLSVGPQIIDVPEFINP